MIFGTDQIVTTVLTGGSLAHWWFVGARQTWLRFATGALLFIGCVRDPKRID